MTTLNKSVVSFADIKATIFATLEKESKAKLDHVIEQNANTLDYVKENKDLINTTLAYALAKDRIEVIEHEYVEDKARPSGETFGGFSLLTMSPFMYYGHDALNPFKGIARAHFNDAEDLDQCDLEVAFNSVEGGRDIYIFVINLEAKFLEAHRMGRLSEDKSMMIPTTFSIKGDQLLDESLAQE